MVAIKESKNLDTKFIDELNGSLMMNHNEQDHVEQVLQTKLTLQGVTNRGQGR